jgi:DNA polymerase (family 10)
MPVHNADIAAIFEEIAELLEIQDANPFRVRAYQNGSRMIGELGREAAAIIESGQELPKIPGIGTDLLAKIHEIVDTGRCHFLDELRSQLPPTITELLHIPGLGPKRVRMLYDSLQVQTLEQLAQAAQAGRIRELPGFGEKTEHMILEALAAHASQTRRFSIAVASQYAEALLAHLKRAPGVDRTVVAGSYRRRKETVGDLDILVTAQAGPPVMQHLLAYDEIADVLSHGDTRSSVVLKSGIQVDVRVVGAESYGAALHYFTGSKPHNIAVRKLGQDKGLKINEYGVFKNEKRIAGDSEESVFAAVDLPFIPPELREDRGEIEAARAGTLPKLIELNNLHGDLHVHSKASDGRNSIEELARQAAARGWQYLAITDHSLRLKVAHGLDRRRLEKQIEEIDLLNGKFNGLRMLKGIEVDILENGELDLPDAVLGKLDLVIGAVHSHFNLPRQQQTERILRAMDHPHFTLLAHPSGREIGKREAYDVDMERIIRHARERGCYLELNAQPERLRQSALWDRTGPARLARSTGRAQYAHAEAIIAIAEKDDVARPAARPPHPARRHPSRPSAVPRSAPSEPAHRSAHRKSPRSPAAPPPAESGRASWPRSPAHRTQEPGRRP